MAAYGEIATIGFIGPPRTNSTVLHEAFKLAPPGVTWCWSTMGLPEFGQTEFDQALSLAALCAKELANRKVDVIVMCGIPLITSKGAPYHEGLERELSAAIDHSIPVTSDINCVIAALKAMKMDEIAVSSLYQRYIQDNMIRYFDHYGVTTLADKALGYSLADCISIPTMTTSFEESAPVIQGTPKAKGLYISCPQWPVIGQIEPLEQASGKPVVTHLTAIMWGGLSKVGVRAPFKGYGKMLEEWPDWVEIQAKAAAA